MRILLGVDDRTLTDHFGHCETFLVVEVEDGKIKGEEKIANPGHTDTISPPLFVAELKVDAVIGGTIGQRAMDIVAKSGAECIFGVAGSADDALAAYLQGELKHDASAVSPPGEHC